MESKFKMFCQEAGKQKPPGTDPGGENAANREKSGGTGRGTSRSILSLGNGQLPVQRVLIVLQIGAVGQDDNIAFL